MSTESSVVESNLDAGKPSTGGRDAALATIDKILNGKSPRPRGRPRKQAAQETDTFGNQKLPESEAPRAKKVPSAKKQPRPALKAKAAEAEPAKPERRARRANLQANPDYQPEPREYGFGDEDYIRPAEAAPGEPQRHDDEESEVEPRAKTYEGLGVEDEPEAVEAPAPKTETEAWPAWLEQALTEQGLDKSDYTSPKAANAALQRSLKHAAPRTEQHQPQQQANSGEGRKQFDPFDGYDRKELADILGEGPANKLLGIVDGIHKHYAEKFGHLEQFADAMYDHVSASRTEKVDGIFSKLNGNDEFKGAFGEGAFGDLEETALETSNRLRTWQAVRQLMAIDNAPLSEATILRAARIAGVTTGKSASKSPREAVVQDDDITEKLKNRARHRVGVGSSTNGHTTLSGRAAAVRKIEGFLR